MLFGVFLGNFSFLDKEVEWGCKVIFNVSLFGLLIFDVLFVIDVILFLLVKLVFC